MKIEPHEIIDLPGTPVAIREAGDVPWHYLGEVKPGTPSLQVLCPTCKARERRNGGYHKPGILPAISLYMPVFHLLPYSFVIDGHRIALWWGRCPACTHVTYGLEFGP